MGEKRADGWPMQPQSGVKACVVVQLPETEPSHSDYMSIASQGHLPLLVSVGSDGKAKSMKCMCKTLGDAVNAITTLTQLPALGQSSPILAIHSKFIQAMFALDGHPVIFVDESGLRIKSPSLDPQSN